MEPWFQSYSGGPGVGAWPRTTGRSATNTYSTMNTVKRLKTPILSLALLTAGLCMAEQPTRILFFSKSSGFEHTVIARMDGKPSYAENVLDGIAKTKGWEFEFSKDGSKFSPDYLKSFHTVIFYTSGDLTKTGKDKQPAMSKEGVKALFEYVRNGGGFIGLHCASDTFHSKGAGTFENHECPSDFICMVGGEFIGHGSQQKATNKVINPKFPGYENLGESFTLMEEWYALKNFNPDMHALTVIDPKGMDGGRKNVYDRPAYPTSWARMEGKGRVYYNAMGHREDVWDGDLFKNMIIGAVEWTSGAKQVEIPANLKEVAPEYHINQFETKPATTAP